MELWAIDIRVVVQSEDLDDGTIANILNAAEDAVDQGDLIEVTLLATHKARIEVTDAPG